MSRVRKEAKIIKNHRREYVWVECTDEDGETFEYPKSRYKAGRVGLAHERLAKAMKRRYVNAAKREYREHGNCNMYRYYTHKACNAMDIHYDYLTWWNIPD